MTQRILTFSISDLAFDSGSVARQLTANCRDHAEHYRVGGACQVDERVFFTLLPVRGPAPAAVYRLVPVEDATADGFAAMLSERWHAGFDALGTIDLGDDLLLVLFACEQVAGE